MVTRAGNGSLKDIVEIGDEDYLIGQERSKVSLQSVLQGKGILEVDEVLDDLLLENLEVVEVGQRCEERFPLLLLVVVDLGDVQELN